MLARINLIRAATTRIDLQTYIFDEDDAGQLVLDELLAAARRGVQVRVLLDQLSALKRVETLAALAGAHANLEVRIYNPVLHRARINYPSTPSPPRAAGASSTSACIRRCCWSTARWASPAGATTRTTITTGTPSSTSATATCSSPGRRRRRWTPPSSPSGTIAAACPSSTSPTWASG
jgi:hypothetical protein